MQNTNHEHHIMHDRSMYIKLAVMTALSFALMYILMYAMVDRFSNVIPNVNQIYMAGLMTMPMVILELIIMRGMYKNKKLNIILLLVGVVGLLSFYFSIRQQTAVGDKQFLKSMIPHHAAAVLMVEKAKISDPEIRKLAGGIISTQQKEIEQMKAKIKELSK